MASGEVASGISEREGEFFDVDEFAVGIEVVEVVPGDGLDAGADLDGVLVEVVHAFLEQLVVAVLDQFLLQ